MKSYCFTLLLFVMVSACKPAADQAQDSSMPEDTSALAQEINELSRAISQDPANAELFSRRAKLFIRQNNLRMAIPDLEKSLQLDSSRVENYIMLADAQFYAGNAGGTRIALEKAIEREPDNADFKLKLAELYLYVKDFDNSIALADQVLRADRKNAKAYFMKGMNFKEKGDTARALSSFQTVIEQEPAYYDAYMQLGILHAARNHPLALEYYNSALKLQPASEEALYGRALFLQENLEFDKAIRDYTQLVTINPNNKFGYFNLGYIHQVDLKVYDQAIKHYSNALAADPAYAEAYYNRGLCYESLGNLEAALADFRQALEFRNDYPAAAAAVQRLSR